MAEEGAVNLSFLQSSASPSPSAWARLVIRKLPARSVSEPCETALGLGWRKRTGVVLEVTVWAELQLPRVRGAST